MLSIRRGRERGYFDYGWLQTFHTFSFADYYDPRQMGFRALRVINEDRVAPGAGFPSHSHRDMEIITYVLAGALEHRDSLGSGTVIRPGDIQRMSAGIGVTHSEFNPSATEPVHFLQIWIAPEREGLEPSYEQRTLPLSQRQGRLQLLAAREPREEAILVQQDVALYAALLGHGQSVVHRLALERHAWLQIARGAVTLRGEALRAGDGCAVSGEESLTIAGVEPAEILLIDLA